MNWYIWERKAEKRTKHIWPKEWISQMIVSYFGLQDSQIPIQRTKWNKPFLTLQNGKQAYFNYSHTKNFFLIGFSEHAEVGVDIEERNLGHKSIGVITNCLAREEREYVEALDEVKKREALLKIWVQKEAIGKAAGAGLIYDTSSVVVKYDLLVHRENFLVTCCGQKISGEVWRENQFWACVACVSSKEQESVSGR